MNRILDLPASCSCRFFVTAYRAEPTRASPRESSLHSPLRRNFNIFSRERRAWITKPRRCSQRKWLRTTPAAQHPHTSNPEAKLQPALAYLTDINVGSQNRSDK